ncbi:MAG: hypothetical protein DRQ51_06090 [Gammaproteobacteria bacterium]|nr:MAG: hypothetical protein DRQ51_06090 [Gammaproteobacteria bacterium]
MSNIKTTTETTHKIYSLPLLIGIWVALVFFTVFTTWIGGSGVFVISTIMLVIMANIFFKSYLIIDFFMGLQQVAFIWRFLMIFYIIFVCSGIVLAYFL